MRLLDRVNRPDDIKPFTGPELTQLSQEIRQELLATISELGGHLASSPAATELGLSLHYVFDAPEDSLVWDMGYQAFVHKLITGRRDRFHTLKQFGGLSGVSNKEESPYDLFTTGHGGTVLSTALGLAMARDQAKADRHVAAIIGDASLGEGMALEALNHIGHAKPNLLVILNDNKMSIAKPVGGLSRYLNRVITNPAYNRVRLDATQLVKRLPHGSKLLRLGQKVEESIKGMLVPGLVFEELGFRYVGPIDGHNFTELIRTLRNVRRLKGPILLHVSTVKGKGYRFAEKDPERFHKTEPFDIATGQPRAKAVTPGKMTLPALETFSDAFSDELVRIAEHHPRVVALTAAMPEGTGVSELARRFPAQCMDVGMAEQHAVGLAAGLARSGGRPVVAIYSTFLQRAFDQIMHEVCLQQVPVVLAIDRAGLVGEDGPTHHGVFDIAYLRILPNLAVVSPKDPDELRAMLRWALEQDGPVALRYNRGGIMCGTPLGRPAKLAMGKAEMLREGPDLALVAIGSMVYPALHVARELAREGISAMVVNARFVKPLDQAMVRRAAQTGRIVTLEEAQVPGGFGSAVSEALDALGLSATAHLRIGLPDTFVEHGKRTELLARVQLDPESLTTRVRAWYHTVRPARGIGAMDTPLIAEPASE